MCRRLRRLVWVGGVGGWVGGLWVSGSLCMCVYVCICVLGGFRGMPEEKSPCWGHPRKTHTQMCKESINPQIPFNVSLIGGCLEHEGLIHVEARGQATSAGEPSSLILGLICFRFVVTFRSA